MGLCVLLELSRGNPSRLAGGVCQVVGLAGEFVMGRRADPSKCPGHVRRDRASGKAVAITGWMPHGTVGHARYYAERGSMLPSRTRSARAYACLKPS